jgi:hypothetical protein
MIRKACWILAIAVFAILIVVSCSPRPPQYQDVVVTDEEYISIAVGTEEARVFMDRFPQSAIQVDRSSRLAVDFRFDRVYPATTTQSWEGIRLRVFIDPESQRVDDSFIQCSDQDADHFVDGNLIEYMDQFAKSQNCP